jgi:hypothetical protein
MRSVKRTTGMCSAEKPLANAQLKNRRGWDEGAARSRLLGRLRELLFPRGRCLAERSEVVRKAKPFVITKISDFRTTMDRKTRFVFRCGERGNISQRDRRRTTRVLRGLVRSAHETATGRGRQEAATTNLSLASKQDINYQDNMKCLETPS